MANVVGSTQAMKLNFVHKKFGKKAACTLQPVKVT